MHALICKLTGETEQTPVAASITVVKDGKVIDTYQHREGKSELIVNLDEAAWVLVDLND